MDTVYKSFPDSLSPQSEARVPGMRLVQGTLWRRHFGVGCPVKITVQSGRLWVTEENDPRDYLLVQGQCFKTRAPGTLIAEALENSVVSIQIEGGAEDAPPLRLANFR